MADPLRREEIEILEPLHPHVTPTITNDEGVRRQRTDSEEHVGPDEHVLHDATPEIVRVVGIPIIRAAHRDDGLKWLGISGGQLKCAEASPRRTEYANFARAPRLLGEPVDDFNAVILLLLYILVLRKPL